MGFLRNRLLRRFTLFGRIADAALVAGAGIRFAHKKGWLSDDQLASFGLDKMANDNASSAMGFGDMALLAGAAWRFLGRRRSSNKLTNRQIRKALKKVG